MIKRSAILICLLVLLSCAINNNKIRNKTYYNKYEVGAIKGINKFYRYNHYEKEMISYSEEKIKNSPDSISLNFAELFNYTKNRSRAYFNFYKNNQHEIRFKKESAHGLPMSCQCRLRDDTLQIISSIGFFGGMVVKIEIKDQHFTTTFIQYTDDALHFKTDVSDTGFVSNVAVHSKFQYLILDEKPTFQDGQQLTGYLDFTSVPYYEEKYPDGLDTLSVEGKIHFTCKTMVLPSDN